jgi:hypothetical protein
MSWNASCYEQKLTSINWKGTSDMKNKSSLIALLSLTLLSGISSFANDKNMDMMMKMTAEQRQKMAMVHEKMGLCLRSDRMLKDCHDEMMKGCEDALGKDKCHMMHGMHHHGSQE